MNDLNPYESGPADSSAKGRTRYSRWMCRIGIGAIVCAGLCILATVIGMMMSHSDFVNRTISPKPAEIAVSISNDLIPLQGVVPLVVIGTIFLILGRSKT